MEAWDYLADVLNYMVFFKDTKSTAVEDNIITEAATTKTSVVENVITTTLQATLPTHSYYPITLELPNFVEPTYSYVSILTMFALSIATIITISSIIIFKKSITTNNKLIFIWMNITGYIHLIVESYFALFHDKIVEDTTILGETWKQYALGDSRYLTSDANVVIIERITAMVMGPLALLTSIGIYKSWPSRHLLQLTLSIGQIYGLVLYYWTTIFEGSPHSRPEAFYFWFYFVGINAIWFIVPSICMIQSWMFLSNVISDNIKRKSKKSL
ncbi:hypothetical protein Glove_508g9 [Diversispora epigaea]|uniref:EXPERA domain-containing protein n=1 Tax=Diversispora epigaea TaxID=1348612 RepID=A0A397GIF8_9GLOM|nr:hypothetical protein Glove_508g9 [Diversispora epigaea]